MADVNTTSIDVAPLTLIVSEALDPRVRRQLEADQQADVKTYQELTRAMEAQDSLNKIKQEVEDKDDDIDPFKQPEAVENKPAEEPTPPPADAADTSNPPAAPTEGEPAANPPPTEGEPAPTEGETADDSEDLSSAFEGYGHKLPKDLIGKVCREFLALESADIEGAGELEHIKQFVYVDLNENAVTGDTLNSVQSLRDPENTIVVINESPDTESEILLRARGVSTQLSQRGVRVFGDLSEATNYLNELYDVIVGRKKD